MASDGSKLQSSIHESTKASINHCLKQFNDFSIAMNEVCNEACLFARSLQTLTEMTTPEIIGGKQLRRTTKGMFQNNAHLMSSLDSFSKIMMMCTDKIKSEAIDSFDNFILQAVMPSDDEVAGVCAHNSQIVHKFHESFFSIYNHFMVLAAELMETFLICSNCATPIGFPHQPLCLTESLSPVSVWKKTRFDDKFITFGMNFFFEDIIEPECRKQILTQITATCLKQCQVQGQGEVLRPSQNAWPHRWVRNKVKKREIVFKKIYCQKRKSFMPNHHQCLGRPSIWTPRAVDSPLSDLNLGMTSIIGDVNN